jgi:hypothetical protein
MSGRNLSAEMGQARRSLSLLHLKALKRLGVGWPDVCELSGDGAMGVLKVSEGEEETFYPDPDGVPHLILPVLEDGGLVDLLAFRSSNPARWLLRSGQGTALGLEHGLEQLSWLLEGEAVHLHKTPLDWLRAGRVGVCIVDWSAPDLHRLCGIPHIYCDDAALAQRLNTALTRPSYLPTITYKEARLAA